MRQFLLLRPYKDFFTLVFSPLLTCYGADRLCQEGRSISNAKSSSPSVHCSNHSWWASPRCFPYSIATNYSVNQGRIPPYDFGLTILDWFPGPTLHLGKDCPQTTYPLRLTWYIQLAKKKYTRL